jgi:hypothetical protein
VPLPESLREGLFWAAAAAFAAAQLGLLFVSLRRTPQDAPLKSRFGRDAELAMLLLPALGLALLLVCAWPAVHAASP